MGSANGERSARDAAATDADELRPDGTHGRLSALSLGELRLGDLITFLAVSRAGSISVAARESAVTPSQVSKAMARIEATLRRRLFARAARGVTLTRAGQAVQPHVEAAVARLLMIERTSDAPTAELSVAAPSSLLGAFLPAIVACLPGSQVRGIELPPALVRAYSADDFFDMCLVPSSHERLPHTWSTVRVGTLRRGLFSTPQVARGLGSHPVHPDKLRGIPFVSPVYYADGHILPSDDHCPVGRADRVLGHQVLAVGLAFEVAAQTGQLVFGPRISAGRWLSAGELVEIPVQGWSVVGELFLACNGDRVRARAQVAVLEALRRTIVAMDAG